MELNDQSISVIGVAHNEESNIADFVKSVDGAFRSLGGRNHELIVVDDASDDGTLKRLEEMKGIYPFLRVIRHKKQKGITLAFRSGLENSRGDIMILLPSDMESDPSEDIPLLTKPIIEEGYDATIGWKSNPRNSVIKSISSFLFNVISRLFLRVDFHDMGWIKAFTREVYEHVIIMRSDWHRVFIAFVLHEGFKVKEIKTPYYPRKKGASKFNYFGILRAYGALFDLLVVKFHLAFSQRPILIFGSAGIFMTIGGIIGLMYLFIIRITKGTISDRFPFLFLLMILTISGLIFLAIGFLAELMVTIKDVLLREMSKRCRDDSSEEI